MQLFNSPTGFGAVSKFFHWAVFLLFVYEYVVANMMLRVKQGDTLLGFTQGTLYNWHKSIGLVLLLLALLRITWRKTVALPDWAPTLTPAERTMSEWTETVLYWCMFLMPVSGYLFVMAGGFGVKLFGMFDLPNPIGTHKTLASAARSVHVLTSYGVVLAVGLHFGSGLRHHVLERDGFLRRMLPFTRPHNRAHE
jgi:cytochrome b561